MNERPVWGSGKRGLNVHNGVLVPEVCLQSSFADRSALRCERTQRTTGWYAHFCHHRVVAPSGPALFVARINHLLSPRIVAAATEKADGRDPPPPSSVAVYKRQEFRKRVLSIGAPIGLASAIVGLWTNDSFQELIHPDVGRAFEAAWNSGQCAEMEAFSKEYPDSPWREEALGFMQHCETVAEYRTLEQIYPVRVDQIDVEAGQSLNEAQQFARSGLHNNANDICSLLERNTQGALESVLLDEEGVNNPAISITMDGIASRKRK